MIALFELFLRLSCIYDIRRKMQIYGAHVSIPITLDIKLILVLFRKAPKRL